MKPQDYWSSWLVTSYFGQILRADANIFPLPFEQKLATTSTKGCGKQARKKKKKKEFHCKGYNTVKLFSTPMQQLFEPRVVAVLSLALPDQRGVCCEDHPLLDVAVGVGVDLDVLELVKGMYRDVSTNVLQISHGVILEIVGNAEPVNIKKIYQTSGVDFKKH